MCLNGARGAGVSRCRHVERAGTRACRKPWRLPAGNVASKRAHRGSAGRRKNERRSHAAIPETIVGRETARLRSDGRPRRCGPRMHCMRIRATRSRRRACRLRGNGNDGLRGERSVFASGSVYVSTPSPIFVVAAPTGHHQTFAPQSAPGRSATTIAGIMSGQLTFNVRIVQSDQAESDRRFMRARAVATTHGARIAAAFAGMRSVRHGNGTRSMPYRRRSAIVAAESACDDQPSPSRAVKTCDGEGGRRMPVRPPAPVSCVVAAHRAQGVRCR